MTSTATKLGPTDFKDEAAKWAAVQTREASADDHFVYSVRTTGIYCRPSCGARLPLRQNVAFHRSASEAEAAGFRACKRCRPNALSLVQRQVGLIAQACRSIEEAETTPSPAQLADGAGVSPHHFHRMFKAVTGLTPKAYADGRKADQVRSVLVGAATVTEALYGAGYGSSGRFYAAAPAVLGMSPTVYRAGGRQIAIRFAVGQSSLGAILVAATDKGVCAILMGDDPDLLARDLQDRFPQAQLRPGGDAFQDWVARVVGLVEAPATGLGLPLDVQGTAFQQRVWQALRAVPAGATMTYSQLAAAIGSPGSARAVAGACAANPVAIAIPCHRIVRHDGGLSGYRWGVERKRALLDREAES